MRRLAVLGLLVLAVPAQAFVGPETKRSDLDGDGERETIRSMRVDRKGVEDRFDQTKIVVTDTCRGQRVSRRIAGPQDNLAFMRFKRADPRPGREVFVDLRSGARALAGETRLVAWRRCAPRNLFRYLTERPTARPRGATGDVASFAVSVRNLTGRYRGLEIVLDERFYARGEPAPSCGTFKKLTYWRYAGGPDRYIRYDTRVKRVSCGGTP